MFHSHRSPSAEDETLERVRANARNDASGLADLAHEVLDFEDIQPGMKVHMLDLLEPEHGNATYYTRAGGGDDV